jgi:signal transduction histidine kinase
MTVGKLASGIAHELGTPLNVVSGRATMLAENVAGEGAVDHARIIRQKAERMATIIRHLLDFARRREPRRVAADVRQIARQTLTLVATLAQKKNVSLELDPASCDGGAFVDPVQIEQVISNLVVNGIQAMDAGGRLSIKLERGMKTQPEVANAAPRDVLSIVVKDEGKGIAPDDVERVFEPFFTTKGVGEGTGLGLSVTYGIVADHGGWISVESREGKGSTFTVHLPTSAEKERKVS